MSKIALIGDSHSEVTFPLLKPKLEQAGHTVSSMVSEIGWATYSFNNQPSYFQTLLQGDPDTIIVALGGNNSKLSDSSYGQSIQTFLSNIGYPQRKVIWISPKRAIREDVERRHEWTSEWLKRNLPNDIIFIDSRPYTEQGHRDDGVHFTRSAYKQFVEKITPKVLSGVSLPPTLYRVKRSIPYIVLVLSLAGLSYAAWRRYNDT